MDPFQHLPVANAHLYLLLTVRVDPFQRLPVANAQMIDLILAAVNQTILRQSWGPRLPVPRYRWSLLPVDKSVLLCALTEYLVSTIMLLSMVPDVHAKVS